MNLSQLIAQVSKNVNGTHTPYDENKSFIVIPTDSKRYQSVLAEYVTKLTAICVKCGRPATRTQRIVNGKPARYVDPIVLIGAEESYEARCRACHKVYRKPNPYKGYLRKSNES